MDIGDGFSYAIYFCGINKKLKTMNRLIFTLLVVIFTTNLYAKKEKAEIISRTNGSITFVVDRNLSKPTNHLDEKRRYTFDNDKSIVASSFRSGEVFRFGSNTMVNMMIKAYAEHRPLELSPDDIWLCISQGMARHVVLNAEKLRDSLVYHKDKITLNVITDKPLFINDNVKEGPNPDVNWPKIFDDFVALLDKNTKGNVTEVMCADFSTTTSESRIASQITLMHALKRYFGYSLLSGCGIPSITLKGTPEDWRKILEKAHNLERYDLEWWLKDLYPVLEEFVAASEGNPNPGFWHSMVRKHSRYKTERGCGGSVSIRKADMFDGWFLTLFPYNGNKRMPAKLKMSKLNLGDFLDVRFKYTNRQKVTEMKFVSGFAGVEEDPETYGLKPRIGWMVERD